MARRFALSLAAALALNFAGALAFGTAITPPQQPHLKTIAYVVAHR